MNKATLIPRILLTIFSLAMGASGLGMLFRAQPLVESITGLGFPNYMLTILGAAYVIGVIALWQPVMPALREWAFAGFTIVAVGGAAAHILNGDGVFAILPLMVLFAMLMGAYFLGRQTK